MKKLWMSIMILSLFTFLFAPVSGIAGPFDQLKNLKIDPKAIMQPKQNAVEFQFTNFKLNPDSGGATRIWNVDLKVTQPIAANSYLVRTVFQNRAGETLFSGEDIVLPAGNAGKTFQLTRPFQKEPPAARMIFQVHNRVENRMVASQRYPLSTISSYGLQGASTSASSKVVVPKSVSESSSSANLTADPDVAFLFSPLREPAFTQKFQIQNKSAFVSRIDAISAKSKFLIGVDQNLEVNCDSREIQPGQSIGCSYYCPSVDCPTLAMIAVEAKLNGNTHHGELKVDAPIKAIEFNPRVTLTKTNGFASILNNGGGRAEVSVGGSYVKPGGVVTMRGLASVDSDRFPVTFTGVQQDGGIWGVCEVMGAKLNAKPDKFCFYLTEIRTCDSMTCGGAGLLLWENDFGGEGINKFIIHKQCK